jgi:putative oxidoreductase
MNVYDLEAVWAPRVLSVLRIVAALLFMEHGTQKLLGFPPSPNPGPALLSLSGIAGVLELFGGALLAAGLFTRPVAFILSGEMAVAYWMAHAPRSFFPLLQPFSTASSFSISRSRAAVPGVSTRCEKLRKRGPSGAEGHWSRRAGFGGL